MSYVLCIYPTLPQNIVMKVQMNCKKCKTKDVRIACKKRKRKKKDR